MVVYFVIFQILPTFVYELFETMQSSVTRSRTSITKSLPASFRLSIFALSSESYIKIHCFDNIKHIPSRSSYGSSIQCPFTDIYFVRFRRINQLQSLRLRIDSQQFADGGFRIQFILVLFDSLCIQRKKDCMPLRSSLISSSGKQSSSKRLPDQENFNFSSSRFA